MKQRSGNSVSSVGRKFCSIESLIEHKEFKQALAELRDLENESGPGELIDESEQFHHLLALALQGVGNYREACRKARRRIELLKNTPWIDKFAQAQYVLGTIYFDMGDLEKAQQELRDAIACFRRLDDRKGTIQILTELAHLHFVKSDYSKAVEYLTECRIYCEETKDSKTEAKVTANLARIYIRTGNWKLAENNLLVAAKVHKESDNKVGFCNGLLSLGYVCTQRRDFGKARGHYEKALKLIYDNNYTREMAIYYEYYGELAFAQRNYFLAKDHYKNGIKIGEEIAPSGDIVSQTYRLLAEVQIAEREYDEALISCEKALKVAESLGERIEIGAIHRALGQIFSAKEDQGKARENFEKSISILEQIGAKFELGKAYLEAVKSNVFEYVDCIAHYANGREIFGELGSDYHLGKTTLAFCEFLFENGEYEKAEVHLKGPEKIFKRLNEKKDFDSVLELKGEIHKALGKVGSPKMLHRAEYRFSDVVTRDPQMLTLIGEVRRFKDSDVPILLEGETGTGKDLLAKVIHYESKRRDRRFVKVNCAAIPENLLESELFGYKRGAFSGADKDKKGLFEEADGGTILLNEIGDLPLRLQAKILDVVEDKELTRLGEVKPRKVDFRVIAATSKDLSEEVGKGDFREDLYHRLNVVELRLPPLQERKGDVPLLIKHFLAEFGIKESCCEDLDESQLCWAYNWPGNVRHLQNELKRLVSILNPFNSKKLIKELSKLDNRKSKGASENFLFDKKAEVEKIEIGEAIKRCRYDKEEAAKVLGISKATLYRKIKQYDLDI